MIALEVVEFTGVEQIREYGRVFSSCFNFELFYLSSGLGKKENSAPLGVKKEAKTTNLNGTE